MRLGDVKEANAPGSAEPFATRGEHGISASNGVDVTDRLGAVNPNCNVSRVRDLHDVCDRLYKAAV